MTLSRFFTRLFLALTGRFTDVRDERGATAVEYALVVGALALVVGVAAAALGTDISNRFDTLLP